MKALLVLAWLTERGPLIHIAEFQGEKCCPNYVLGNLAIEMANQFASRFFLEELCLYSVLFCPPLPRTQMWAML